jgi:hypothetical protein
MSSKRILVSGHITSQIEAWQENSDTFNYGLVLGHFGGKELMIVHLARSPLEESEDDAEAKEPKKLSDIDPGWLMEHVKQVRAMLPGGMDVQGLFFVTKESVFQPKNESKVIDCLQQLKASMKMDEPVLWPVFLYQEKINPS